MAELRGTSFAPGFDEISKWQHCAVGHHSSDVITCMEPQKLVAKNRRNFRSGDERIRMFNCIRHLILQTSWIKIIIALGQPAE